MEAEGGGGERGEEMGVGEGQGEYKERIVEGGGRMKWRQERGGGVAYSILSQLSAQRDVFHVELYFKCLHKGQG